MQKTRGKKMAKKQFRDFESAREFARGLGFKSQNEWRVFVKSSKKPEDIPSNPDQVFKKSGDWISWGDFLGTGSIANQKRKFSSYKEAKDFVKALGISGQSEWKKFVKTGKIPPEIPKDPQGAYMYKGWISWGNFLGTGSIAPKNKKFRSFTDSKQFARALGFHNVREWEIYCKSGKKPDDIPSSPSKFYAKEWKSWGDWLGTGRIQTQQREYLSFNDARNFIRGLGLKNHIEWKAYCKPDQKPVDLPAAPERVYKKDWKGLGDWLGTGRIQTQQREYLSFNDARNFVRKLNLKDNTKWRKYAQSDERPDNIPSLPHKTYKNKGWISLGDWLGTDSIATFNRKYRKFEDARKFIRNLKLKNHIEWTEYCKSGQKPDDIPAAPWNVYKQWGENNGKKRRT